MIKSIFLIVSLVFLGSGFAFAQSTTYTLTLHSKNLISESEVLSIFEGHPEIRNVQLADGKLSITVPSKDNYSVTVIREMLAERNITALDYTETVGEKKISAKVKSLETTSFRVYGNCGMCKDRIERAARSIKGVVVAVWEEEKSMITIKYQPSLVEVEAIHKALAKVGHDTDSVRANDADYQDLHSCCKYERPQMDKRK